MASWCDDTATADKAEKARALNIFPLDASNASLLDAVRPLEWKDGERNDYDIVVIGAGAGGLVTAKQAGRRGFNSAMISEHLAGGDCLNVGCVPSKALLHCAKVAREAQSAVAEGILVSGDGGAAPALAVDFGAVMSRMRRLRAKIAPADAHTATVGAGADVYQGRGVFTGPTTVEVNGKTLRFKKACIATGGSASVPSPAQMPGLAAAPYLTNATLFNLTQLPPRLVILGAGAVGLEMAQAFACFGAKVTVVTRSTVLSHESTDARLAVQRALEQDGVEFVVGASICSVETLRAGGGAYGQHGTEWPLMRVTAAVAEPSAVGTKRSLDAASSNPTAMTTLECEALLVATGRTPNTAVLGLERAGIEHGPCGIVIDQLACTTNPNVYAVGDCAAGVPRFTHVR